MISFMGTVLRNPVFLMQLKQRTLKMKVDQINFIMLKDEFEIICPWIQGHHAKLLYHDPESSPKMYLLLENDYDIVTMVEKAKDLGRVEIIVDINEVMQSVPNYSSGGDNNLQMVGTSTRFGEQVVSNQALEDVTISVGTQFDSALYFKNALRSYAIKKNFGIKTKASDKKRVICTCAYRGCPWRIRASLCSDSQKFEVRRLEGSHICPGINRSGNKQVTISWVASEIQALVKEQPQIPPKQINRTLESSYGLSLSYMKLWRSREVAREIAFGPIDENYKWVPTLAAELSKRNPGSRIIYTYDDENSFQRFFVSFKVSIEGFLYGCKPLIGIDACHLKSKYLGVLLSANTLDGNNGLFTLAFAVVETESKGTWKWFLEQLHQSFGFNLFSLSFISDMGKGIYEAVKEVFSYAEHRVCVRHLWKNLKKHFHHANDHSMQDLV